MPTWATETPIWQFREFDMTWDAFEILKGQCVFETTVFLWGKTMVSR